MARAKRTDRAERAAVIAPRWPRPAPPSRTSIRRRGRAGQAAPPRGRPPPRQRLRRGRARPDAAPWHRLRLPHRLPPLDLRGDLKALPGLLKHPAFSGPLLLSAAAVAAIPIFGRRRR